VFLLVKKNVDIVFSAQAELIIENICDFDKEDLLTWFTEVRKISIGGGDIVNYLAYRKDKNSGLENKQD
jgi:hypothetical protein